MARLLDTRGTERGAVLGGGLPQSTDLQAASTLPPSRSSGTSQTPILLVGGHTGSRLTMPGWEKVLAGQALKAGVGCRIKERAAENQLLSKPEESRSPSPLSREAHVSSKARHHLQPGGWLK